jgi:RING-like zinc finger
MTVANSVIALLCLQVLRYRYLDVHTHFYGVPQPSHIGVLANTTLSNNSIELLPIHTYVDIEENISNRTDYDICAICLDQFEENVSQVRKLPCKHVFHAACIGKGILSVGLG